MFSPRLIFFVLWASQILLHLIFHDVFYDFLIETWVVILLGVISFIIGTFFSQFIIESKNKKIFKKNLNFLDIDFLIKLFFIFYIPIFIYAIFSVKSILFSMGLSGFNAPLIRQLVIEDFNADRIIFAWSRCFHIGVGFCIFFLAFSNKISKTNIFLLILCGLISALATTGRLFLLLFFSSTIILLYRNKIVSMKTVFVFFGLFLFLFFGIAIFLGKGSENNAGGIGSGVLWNAQIYLMSSVSCFNDYVGGNVSDSDGSILIPNQIKMIFNGLGFDIPLRAALNPFSYVPEPCNTYTIFFPLFHDAGLLGVIIGLFIIGSGHYFIYVRYKYLDQRIWWYVYAISVYPLIMTVFEDAYFSSIGFWITLWMPPIMYSILRLTGICRRKYI